MFKKRIKLNTFSITTRNIQFFCLFLLGTIEFYMFAFGLNYDWIGLYLGERYLVIPGLLFLGATLPTQLTQAAKRILFVGVVMVIWICIAQTGQWFYGEGPENINMLWTVYLLAFPFALATNDKKQNGLKLISIFSIMTSIVLSLYGLLLLLDILPSFIQNVSWDGGRLISMWHPNITACLMMIGIAFCFSYLVQSKRLWTRSVFLLLIVLQFLMMALTNSRTTIIMTCFLIASFTFLIFFKKSLKQIVICGLVTFISFVSLVVISNFVFNKNYDRLLKTYIEEQKENMITDISTADEDFQIPTTLPIVNGQGSLTSDLRTLNGRTVIWKAAFQKMVEYPISFIRGMSDTYINNTSSVHTHNSWFQVLISYGIPALLISLYITLIALKNIVFLLINPSSTFDKKCISLLVLCLLGTGALEPYLFVEYSSWFHFINVIFFICLGYLCYWRKELE